jgi:hypothetical protein
MELRIIESKSLASVPRYIVLSYCWGKGSDDHVLKVGNENTMRSGFGLDSLPKTIAQAIQVTERLGARYLWVDALCIIQDSDDDWQREAAEMRDVYRNSWLAIAALGAKGSEDGLHARRDPLSYRPCWLFNDITYKGGDKLECSVYACPWSGDDSLPRFPAWYEEAPLHTRGWVFQERYLAPRTLNFGLTLVFECLEAFHTNFLRLGRS